MPLIRPLRALRYGANAVDDLSRLVSPPAPGDLDPRCVRHLVHGDDGPLAAPSDPPFTHAARLLERWKQDGVLVRDPRPAFYTVEQDDGRPRRGLGVLVRLSPFEDGVILPHEATRGASTEQLLAQLQATETQFSLIMGIVADASGALRDFLARERPTLVDVVDGDGVRNRLWRDEDPAAQRELAAALRDEPVVIADGHHRYEAALAWQRARGGPGHRERPFDYAMMMLVPVDDPGLRCQPSHRVLETPLSADARRALEALDRDFEVLELPDAEALRAFLGRADGHRFGLVRPGRLQGLRLRQDAALDSLDEALRDVDAELAQRLLLDPLGWSNDAGETGRSGSRWAHNRASTDQVVERVFGGDASLALLLRAPLPSQVLRVARAGALTPPKSTNFVPKAAKGVVMASLKSF